VTHHHFTGNSPGAAIPPEHKSSVFRRLLPLISLGLVAGLLYREISGIDLRQLQVTVQNVPTIDFLGVATAGLVAVSAMVIYDWLLCRWLEVDIPPRALFRLSWVANSINNAMSMGGLTGSGIRYLVLTRYGLTGGQLAVYSILLVATIPVGLSVPAFVLGLSRPDLLANLPVGHLFGYVVPVLMGVYGIAYLAGAGQNQVRRRFLSDIPPLPVRYRFLLFAASFLDWLLAAVVLWLCLVVCAVKISGGYFVATFVLAGALGSVSFVPGALGVFDGLVLAGLNHGGAAPEAALTALLLYRFSYLLIPLLVGLQAGGALIRIRQDSTTARLLNRVVGHPLVRMLGLPARLAGTVLVRALAYLTFFAGLILLMSSAFPVVGQRVATISSFVPVAAIESAHLLGTLSGILLIAVSRGIAARVRSSHRLALTMLIAGAGLSLLKGIQIELAIFLVVIAGLLAGARGEFVRDSYALFSWRSIRWLALMLASLGLFLFVGAVIHEQPRTMEILSRYGPAAASPRFWRGALVATIALLVYLAWSWYRMPKPQLRLPNRDELLNARNFYQRYGGTTYSHLTFMGDKHLFYAAGGHALVQFGAIRNRWVSMGDPAGECDSFDQAITQFREQVFQFGCDPVFYHVEEDSVHHYHDTGFALLKLGERALVELGRFTLTGRKAEDFRSALNRAKREGLEFSILDHPLPEEVWHELSGVSDSWLVNKTGAEKTFSIGAFDRTYLEWSPIAVVQRSGRIIAFANVMPGYGHLRECSIDLMRHVETAPPGTMDFLFVKLIEFAKISGYQYFSLGEAPFSGVGRTRWSFRRERLVRFIYEHGSPFYNYKGLRTFKDKFHPVWRSSYLAYPYNRNVELLLLDIAALVAGGYRRILQK